MRYWLGRSRKVVSNRERWFRAVLDKSSLPLRENSRSPTIWLTAMTQLDGAYPLSYEFIGRDAERST